MRRLIVASACVLMVSGCSTAVNHRCGLPNLPECVDVHTAYQQSLAKVRGGESDSGSAGFGYTPTAQPTQTVDVQRSVVRKGSGKKAKVSVVESVKTYLDQTRPLDPATGFGPNGVPLAVGNQNDDSLYYASTPDALPTGYVPPQFVRVWVPRWQNREGDMIHESYFDMMLENGHWADGIKAESLRSRPVRKKDAGNPLAGYVKYVADYTWGRRVWERDARGNVTVTTKRKDTGKKAVQHYPAGTHAPFPLGKRVYPPLAPSRMEQGLLKPGGAPAASQQGQRQQSLRVPAGAPASVRQQTRPPVAPLQ